MRYAKTADGKYKINGVIYDILEGTRVQVWHGTAFKTSGGLTRAQLTKNAQGRVVSKSKFESAKKEQRLRRYGYGTRKGKFGYVRAHNSRRSTRRSPSTTAVMYDL
jgi:hypothetical protein